MKAIRLKGKGEHYAYVDDEDFDRINQHYWYKLIARGSLTIYARTVIDGKTVYMHRMVMNAPDDMTVDHADRDGLNCTKANLEVMTQGDNMRAWIPPPDPNYVPVHTVRSKGKTYRYNRRTKERLGT